MSKYTTEVRYICEQKSGVTGNDIDKAIAGSWNQIFSSAIPFFDEKYRQPLCEKILRHFYFREIGLETVGLWTQFLNRKLIEIMPYYNQLYGLSVLEFNPLYDVDYTETRNDEGTSDTTDTGTKTSSNTRTDDYGSKRTDNFTTEREDDLQQTRVDNLESKTENDLTNTVDMEGSTTSNRTHLDAYQETPQGNLDMVSDLNYLTNARRITDTDGDNNTGNSTETRTGNVTVNNTGDVTTNFDGTQTTTNTGTQTTENTGTQKNEGTDTEQKTSNVKTTNEYITHVMGKRGGMTYAKMIMEFRETFVNIDMMIINELEPLFMSIW